MINVTQSNLAIIGCGSLNTIFDNQGASSDTNDLIRITGSNILLTGFSVTQYNRSSGGGKAITITGGSVDFDDIILFNNLSNGNAALYITGGSTVVFTNSASTCNSAFLFGGGIDVIGNSNSLTIINSILANNDKANNGDGGGLLIDGNNNTVVITNTLFQDNDAVNGGAIAVKSGTVGNGNTLTLTNCCFENNLAAQTSSAPSGGAILIGEGEVTATITNCTFTNNRAGEFVAESGNGGAISIDTAIGTGSGNVNVNIMQCSFVGNTATEGGDHIYGNEGDPAFVTISQCTFVASGDDIQQRTSTEVEFTITNSGSPTLTNINPEPGSNTNPPNLTANPSCPIFTGDGCTLACTLNITGIGITVSDICLGSDATVTISGATALNNGNYTIIYDLTGVNTVTSLSANITITSGATTFSIPSASITNTGPTTIIITNITENVSGCSSAVNLSSNFTVLTVPSAPVLTTLASSCTSDGSTTITNYDGTLTYTFSPSGPCL